MLPGLIVRGNAPRMPPGRECPGAPVPAKSMLNRSPESNVALIALALIVLASAILFAVPYLVAAFTY